MVSNWNHRSFLWCWMGAWVQWLHWSSLLNVCYPMCQCMLFIIQSIFVCVSVCVCLCRCNTEQFTWEEREFGEDAELLGRGFLPRCEHPHQRAQEGHWGLWEALPTQGAHLVRAVLFSNHFITWHIEYLIDFFHSLFTHRMANIEQNVINIW